MEGCLEKSRKKYVEVGVHTKQVLLVALLFASVAKSEGKAKAKANCSRNYCGSVMVPFPFGMSEECSLDTSFVLTCNRTLSPQSLFLKEYSSSVRVLNISLDGQLDISLPIAINCLQSQSNQSVNIGSNDQDWRFTFDLAPFHLSSKKNKLTVVGSNAAGLLWPLNGTSYTAACVSLSDVEPAPASEDTSCSGTFCCETLIQRNLSNFLYLSSTNIFNSNGSQLRDSDRCGYAFLVKDGAYKFSSNDLVDLASSNTIFPVVADWAVGNRTCQQATSDNHSTFACRSDNSYCYDVKPGPAYRCNCSSGFRGREFLPYPPILGGF